MALSGHVARSHKCPLLGGKAVVLRRGRRCRDGWKPPHIHICSVRRRELGVWDLSHSLSGTSLVGLSITEIPLNYGIFCSTYDFVVVLSHNKCHRVARAEQVRPLLLAASPVIPPHSWHILGDAKSNPFRYLLHRGFRRYSFLSKADMS